MIAYGEAIEVVLKNTRKLGTETVEIISSVERVLREDIYSDIDNPPFDNSEMDGYAVKAQDTKNASKLNPVILKISDTIPAGKITAYKLKKGETACIMTGAQIPEGANAVIKVEDTKNISENEIEINKNISKGNHIRYKGEDLQKGELILKNGIRITPPIISLLAMVGKKYVKVSQKPRVGILITGDELVEPEITPPPGKIRNCSAYYLYSQIIKEGGIPSYYGIIKDNYAEIKEKIYEILNLSDILITTGGVSVGKYDYVSKIFEELDVDIKFRKVAIKPGKPTVFGTKNSNIIFGLPGNPVSTIITFTKFVSPCISKMMGIESSQRKIIPCISDENISLEKGRKNFVRVRVEKRNNQIYAKTTGAQASARLKSIIKAEGIMLLSEQKNEVKKGEMVLVELF
ncbi:gephyrin-like molybdotransferase Glp [candidate division KSB1 bacterium]